HCATSDDPAATGAPVTIAIPAATTYMAGSADHGVTLVGSTLHWTLHLFPTRRSSDLFSVTVNSNVVNGQKIDNTAVVAGNNTNTTEHTLAFPIITGAKGAVPAPGTSVKPGDTITYSVTVTNTGDAAASAVPVNDAVPA